MNRPQWVKPSGSHDGELTKLANHPKIIHCSLNIFDDILLINRHYWEKTDDLLIIFAKIRPSCLNQLLCNSKCYQLVFMYVTCKGRQNPRERIVHRGRIRAVYTHTNMHVLYVGASFFTMSIGISNWMFICVMICYMNIAMRFCAVSYSYNNGLQ